MECRDDLIDLKKQGNEHYNKGEYYKSIDIYTEILNAIDSKPECEDSKEFDSVAGSNEYVEIKLQVLLNRCASFIKVKDYEHGLKDSNEALKIKGNDVKGLFRRACCLVNMETKDDLSRINNLNECVEDLKKALIIEQNNQQVRHLLQDVIEQKSRLENNMHINKLPSEMFKTVRNIVCEENEFDINDEKNELAKELSCKLEDIYLYILSNGNHDILLNSSCTNDIISIFEYTNKQLGDQLIYACIRNSNKLGLSILLNLWNILCILLEDNDLLVDDKCGNNYGDNFNFKFKKYDSFTKCKQLINFRNSVKNSNIINYTRIKTFINNYLVHNDAENGFNNKVTILNNIFNILLCINNQHIHEINYFNFLISLIDDNLSFIDNKSINDVLNVLISLILRNISIIFKNRKSMTNKLKAIEYSREIEKLISSLFNLSYKYYGNLLFNIQYSINNKDMFGNIIKNCELILSIIFSLLSEKERSDNVDINAISNNQFINKYLLKSIMKYDSCQDKSTNWIVYDYLSFLTGLVGMKVLHFSNRAVLKNYIINYPQIIHCILLFIVTNNKEYNSLLSSSLKSLSYIPSNDIYDLIIKTNCIEVISLVMEYREIRSCIVKDEDTVVILYNNCKYIVDDEYNNINDNANVNISKLNSCCRLLNGISKFTVENNDILFLIIDQLNICGILNKLWFIINKINTSEEEYWSFRQNYFEMLTILSMHKKFKNMLFDFKMIDNNSELLLLCILDISNVINLNDNIRKNKYRPPHSFLYLYLSFIQNLLTCNESDPSSEVIVDDNNKNIYFLKRQRFYKQLNSENHFDFDQSQLEELEIMYNKLPKYSKNEKNGHYDRGDDSLVNKFRIMIIENTNVISYMYTILNNYIYHNSNMLDENNKSLLISSSIPIILNISNNICDLITMNNDDSKLLLLHRGKIIQNGGLKCLLDSITILDNEINDMNNSSKSFLTNKKYIIDRIREYKQAISRLLIYISPSLVSYKLLLESAIKIQSLLDDEHELLQYESALAITNILSKSFDKLSQDIENDSITIRIYNNGLGWSLFKNLCFSDNILLRSTGLEGLCNFCNKDYVVLTHFINNKSNGIEDLKLFVAFSMENDNRIQKASLGALAMLSSYSDVSKIILDNWDDVGCKLIEISSDNNVINNIELKERLLFCLNNLLFSSSQNKNVAHNCTNINGNNIINIIKESISLLT